MLGGGRVSVGSMINSLEAHALLRTGNMSPYFDGLLEQYAHKDHSQVYLSVKPSVQYVLYNSLLEGGLFSKDVYVEPEVREAAGNLERPPMRRLMADVELSAVLSLKRFAVTFSQKFNTKDFEDLPAQHVGNISIYLGF
ncbi:lipid A-modifier LpxR family protein [Chitinophaga sedimenti]|uniref:lipid A-modifier LpxR family protein n=1 Tax=Chitinophaga sedimenti TaxID=2033606 RepID=UPI00249F36CE|nr:lipid A-modifier LpxR family protein [Chitinophaga sedimenti]